VNAASVAGDDGATGGVAAGAEFLCCNGTTTLGVRQALKELLLTSQLPTGDEQRTARTSEKKERGSVGVWVWEAEERS